MDFTEQEYLRYSRQTVLPEVGPEGQQLLRAGKVLLVGAGGLSAPAAFYLAAAGVGTIGIMDGDRVEESNLQRQILHTVSDIGRPKVDSAREKLLALNPHCRVVTYRERLGEQNIESCLADYDVLVDAVDNFPTRYLLNRACVENGKVLVHGGALGFIGQVFTIVPGRGPCLRCLLPEPSPEAVPAPAAVGVLGVVAGLIGMLQAAEVLKYLLGQGELLVGRLLSYRALETRFVEMQVLRDPACPVCGKNSTPKAD